MFDLMAAFLLYQFDAGPLWWGAYVALIVMELLGGFHRGYNEEN